jgi:hypothetical protein
VAPLLPDHLASGPIPPSLFFLPCALLRFEIGVYSYEFPPMMELNGHEFGDKRFGQQLFRDLKVDENGMKDAISVYVVKANMSHIRMRM